MNIIKSPIFYMGNKYRLLPKLLKLFPKECDIFVDLFGGSGCVSGNYFGKNLTIYNELNPNIYNLCKMFTELDADKIISHIKTNIEKWNLGYNTLNDKDIKTNIYRENYIKFRDFYNHSERDILDLYTLIFYSFSNLLRFNSESEFNMPWGIRCFTQDHEWLIINWCNRIKDKNLLFYNDDYKITLSKIKDNLTTNSFVYLDPPYLQTMAVYNESHAFGGWGIDNDYELFSELDNLTKLGVKWGLSNVFTNRGKENTHLKEWCTKNGYFIHHLDIDYAALGKGKADSDEVYICNYEAENKPHNKKSLI